MAEAAPTPGLIDTGVEPDARAARHLVRELGLLPVATQRQRIGSRTISEPRMRSSQKGAVKPPTAPISPAGGEDCRSG